MTAPSLDVVVGLPEKEETAKALRDLADLVETGQVSGLMLVWRASAAGGVFNILHASVDPRLGEAVLEDMRDALADYLAERAGW